MAGEPSKHTEKNRKILAQVEQNIRYPIVDTTGTKAFIDRKRQEEQKIKDRPYFGKRTIDDNRETVPDVPQA